MRARAIKISNGIKSRKTDRMIIETSRISQISLTIAYNLFCMHNRELLKYIIYLYYTYICIYRTSTPK